MIFPFHRKKYCLVLGGGGTKGIYELGVWKALREQGIPIEAVIGTSIGAINGLWIAQDDFEAAERTWDSITLDKVLRLPGDFEPPPPGTEDWRTLDVIWRIYRRQGRLDTSPLRALVEAHFEPGRLARSAVDLGIVTFNLSRLKPEVVFARETDPSKLVDYLMASSTFPGFDLSRVDRNLYLDGGLADNLPIEVARRRGYRRLIVVDVGGIGVRHPIDPWGLEAVFIRNSDRLGHVLEFRREWLQRAKTMGYLDALKALSKLEGERFYLKPDDGWYRDWNRLLHSSEFLSDLPPALRDWRGALGPQRAMHKNPARCLLEAAAGALGIERLSVYTPKELTAQVLSAYTTLLKKVEGSDLEPYRGFEGLLRSEWAKVKIIPGLFQSAPLEVDLALHRLGFAELHPWVIDSLHRFYPDLRAAKIFLYLAARWSDRFPALPAKLLT